MQEAERGFTVRALLTLGGYYSRESRLMRAAQRLYAATTEQAANPAFLTGAPAAGWDEAGLSGPGLGPQPALRTLADPPRPPPPVLPPAAAMGVPVEFQQTHSSLCLHIWLLLTRLRAEGKDGKRLAQVREEPARAGVCKGCSSSRLRLLPARPSTSTHPCTALHGRTPPTPAAAVR